MVCLKLDRGWFMDDKKPTLPRHLFCHCFTEDIPFSRVLNEATSECVITKIDPYLFDPKGSYGHGKGKLFESWGYSVADAQWLQNELKTQGLDKYINGQYQLGLLNEQGQRIRIRVEIPRKDRAETVSFETGWLVEPMGHIRLVTPYADK